MPEIKNHSSKTQNQNRKDEKEKVLTEKIPQTTTQEEIYQKWVSFLEGKKIQRRYR